MRNLLITTIVAVAMVTSANAQTDESRVQQAKQAVERTLKDPLSVQYRDLGIYLQLGTNKRTVCGEYNAKNSYGGYVGFKRFWVDADGELRIEGAGQDETSPDLFAVLRQSYCSKLLKSAR